MRGVINIIDREQDKVFKKTKAVAKTFIIDDLTNIIDASCVYFSNTELIKSGNGQLPYSDQHLLNQASIPYICRWSFEIKRNILHDKKIN